MQLQYNRNVTHHVHVAVNASMSLSCGIDVASF